MSEYSDSVPPTIEPVFNNVNSVTQNRHILSPCVITIWKRICTHTYGNRFPFPTAPRFIPHNASRGRDLEGRVVSKPASSSRAMITLAYPRHALTATVIIGNIDVHPSNDILQNVIKSMSFARMIS